MGTARGGVNKVSDLTLTPLWLNPGHSVATARHVLTGHKARAIGILEGEALHGIVGYENLAGRSDETELRHVLSPVGLMVSPTSSLREVALILAKENLEYLPVIEEGRFRGIVTATMLLREMSRTWDPLTELPWSDRLREWGVDKLENGDEITILFVDLDDFGQYNKAHGHIVGDRVLQLVARTLRESIDDRKDVLVRYGGDEFAIGTLRHRREAEDLMDAVQDRMIGAFVSGAERPVEVSIGLFGGRRTTERENVHYSATLDSLINLASKDCLARKSARKTERGRQEALLADLHPTSDSGSTAPGGTGAMHGSARPKVVEVLVDENAERGVAMATLEVGGKVYRGVSARVGGATAAESVAQATISALERWSENMRLSMTSLTVEKMGDVWLVAFVGTRTMDGADAVIIGRVESGGDKMLAVGEAVIEAAYM